MVAYVEKTPYCNNLRFSQMLGFSIGRTLWIFGAASLIASQMEAIGTS
jgi:hypothetical protein